MYHACSRANCLNSCGVLPLLNDLYSLNLNLCLGRLVYKDFYVSIDWFTRLVIVSRLGMWR